MLSGLSPSVPECRHYLGFQQSSVPGNQMSSGDTACADDQSVERILDRRERCEGLDLKEVKRKKLQAGCLLECRAQLRQAYPDLIPLPKQGDLGGYGRGNPGNRSAGLDCLQGAAGCLSQFCRRSQGIDTCMSIQHIIGQIPLTLSRPGIPRSPTGLPRSRHHSGSGFPDIGRGICPGRGPAPFPPAGSRGHEPPAQIGSAAGSARALPAAV